MAHVLGADVVEGRAGEIGDVLLGGGAVLEHHGRIGQVDLVRELVDLGLLLFGEDGLLLGFLNRRRRGGDGFGGLRRGSFGLSEHGGRIGSDGFVAEGQFDFRHVRFLHSL